MTSAGWHKVRPEYGAFAKLCGYVKATYDQVVSILGEPNAPGSYKVDWEWVIEFDDGMLATIYNYEDGPAFTGLKLTGLSNITREWHVGGRGEGVLSRVAELLRRPVRPVTTRSKK